MCCESKLLSLGGHVLVIRASVDTICRDGTGQVIGTQKAFKLGENS